MFHISGLSYHVVELPRTFILYIELDRCPPQKILKTV